MLLASHSGAAFAQDGAKATSTRTVQLAPQFPDPVKIVRVLFDGVEVKPALQAYPTDKPGVPFQGADDWFNHLAIILKNTSSKTVVYADVRIFFLDTGNGTPQHPLVGDGNQVGERPKHARYSTIRGAWQNDPRRNPIHIEPGQEFSVPAIDPNRFEEVKQSIESVQPLFNVMLVRIDVPTVYFEDGTKWGGGYFRPDYSAPGKYIHISQREFEDYRQEASQ
ncbi:MAG TPA: hypothetical protein VGG14_01675 [Candidatus Sulfotelmatobacter sp.]|jgi:hypothetical protein